MNYSKELFKNYRKSHNQISGLESSVGENFAYNYYCTYYKKLFSEFSRDSSILEIGCNAGYMLKQMTVVDGFENLIGIDLSPDDLEIAKNILPKNVKLECVDAFDFLKDKDSMYDLIFSKAVFEHIEKSRVMELIELCKKALKPGGALIIEVPNMDWIHAPHERYKDFTHEIGFTKESLGQLFRNIFGNCEIYYVDNSNRRRGIRMRIARAIFVWLYYWSEPVIERESLFSRGIVAFGKKI